MRSEPIHSGRLLKAPPSAHRGFEPVSFRPSPLLPGAHAQTLGGKVLRRPPTLGTERLRLATPDDDFIDLDVGPDPGGDRPVVLVLHGLEGSTRRAYVRIAMSHIADRAMLPVGMNFRGCSGEMNRQARFYHSGDTVDLEFVLSELIRRYPGRALGVLGFSLGGNVLLRYLGGAPESMPPELGAAAAISVPYDLTEGTRMLETGVMGSVYSGYFLRSLQSKARLKGEVLGRVVDLERVLAARTVREFDEAATAPLHGFGSAEEYYLEASSGPHLPSVRVPTLLVHADDDPFLPSEAIPRAEVHANPWLAPAFTRRGGHVGFVTRLRKERASFWAEAEAVRYLSELLVEG